MSSVLQPVFPPVDLQRVDPPFRHTTITTPPFRLPPPSRHAAPSTRADITTEARRGLLICSQLQPRKLLRGKDFKLLWNPKRNNLRPRENIPGDEARRRPGLARCGSSDDALLQFEASAGLRGYNQSSVVAWKCKMFDKSGCWNVQICVLCMQF